MIKKVKLNKKLKLPHIYTISGILLLILAIIYSEIKISMENSFIIIIIVLIIFLYWFSLDKTKKQ